MRANRVRDIWQAGGAVINGWCGIPSGFSAEVMAHMGWDSLVIDTQHGIVGYETMVAMLQGISTTAVTPMVRVPWNNPADIMKALAAYKKILAGCKRHGVFPGIHTGSTAYAKRMIEMGFQFTTLLGDARLLTMAGQQVVQEMRAGAPVKAAAAGSSTY